MKCKCKSAPDYHREDCPQYDIYGNLVNEFFIGSIKNIIDFEINSILDVSSWIEPEVGYYVVTFLCFVSGSPNIRLSDEHKNYVWISPNDLDKYNFWHPDIKKRIQKAFSTIAE